VSIKTTFGGIESEERAIEAMDGFKAESVKAFYDDIVRSAT